MNSEKSFENKISRIKNASIFLEIKKEFWSFYKYIWSLIWWKRKINKFSLPSKIPVSTPDSDKISKDLKKRGMKFVWSTIIYAFMQAVGIVNDHEKWCFRYKEV